MAAVEAAAGRSDAPIIGRESDLADLGALLDDHAPLVTVTGRGGVGKTRLAREVLAAHRRLRRGPAAFVELTSVRDPDLVLPEVAARLGVPVPAGRAVLEAVAGGLADDRLLLVLDNFEHVLPAAADVGALVDRCPSLRVLVTSQAPLRLRAERILRLEPLPVPAADEWAGANASVQLYCERATAADASFTLDRNNVEAVAELCRRLEGLPLAIELAAVRSATLPATEILARLDEIPFDLLRGTQVDVAPRHHDLRAAIAWTDALLADEDRRLLRSISVAAGPVTLDEAAALVGVDLGDAVEGMTHLIDFRLVDRVVDSEPARFAVPWSIAEYAREALVVSGAADAVQRRYVEVMADAADAIGRGLRTDPARWITVAVESEAELLHAVDRAARMGAWNDGLRLLRALGQLWRSRGYPDALPPYFDRILDHAPQDEIDLGAYAEVLAWAALLDLSSFARDRYDLARERLDLAQEMAGRSGDPDTRLRALSSAVLTSQYTGDFPRAMAAVADARAMVDGLPYWQARFDAWDGMLVGLAGDVDGAIERGRRALATARRAGDPEAELIALLLLRPLAAERPDLERELGSWVDNLELARRSGFVVLDASLGPIAMSEAAGSGDRSAALAVATDVLILARAFADTHLGTIAVMAAAQLLQTLGDDAASATVHGMLRPQLAALETLCGPLMFGRYRDAIGEAERRLGTEGFARHEVEGAGFDVGAGIAFALERLRALGEGTSAADLAATVGLTPRQLDVLQLVAAGYTNKEVASALGIAPKTVTHHLSAVFLALGVRTRTEAALWASAHGLAG